MSPEMYAEEATTSSCRNFLASNVAKTTSSEVADWQNSKGYDNFYYAEDAGKYEGSDHTLTTNDMQESAKTESSNVP